MIRRQFLLALLTLLLITPASAHAQAWSGILDPSRATDWTQAGITGGIPNRTQVCQTVSMVNTGTPSSDAPANATAIQNAIKACASSNQVVQLPAGTWYTNGFYISGSSGSAIYSNVTLRGAGPDKTILLMQSTVNCYNHADICIGGNANSIGRYNGGASWTGDNGTTGLYNKGDTVINVGSWTGTAPSVNDLIVLDQRDDAIGICPASGGKGNCPSGTTGITGGASESGTTVTIVTSLPHGFSVGQTVNVGGVTQPPPVNGALAGQLYQWIGYPNAASCSSNVVTMNFPYSFFVLGPQTVSITGGAWSGGTETLTVASNPFSGYVNGIRSVTISGTGSALDGNTYIIAYTGTNSTHIAFSVATNPGTITTGTASWPGDTIWISGSQTPDYSGVFTVAGANTSTRAITYKVPSCSGSFTKGNMVYDPITYTGQWTITNVGCVVGGVYTTSTSCGANPINAFQYTDPVSGLPASGGGQASVDNGGFYVACVGGPTCSSEQGAGFPATGRTCPATNYGSGGTGQCATGEYSYREQEEIKRVVAINGSQITIDPPIENPNWRTSQNPGVFFLGTGTYVTGDGIENLTVDGTNDNCGSYICSLVLFTDAYKSWARNMRTIQGDRNHIWVAGPSARISVVDSYFWGTKSGASKSYGVEVGSGTSDNLIQNNICQHVVSCLMVAGDSGSVYAYNYGMDSGYTTTTTNMWLLAANHDFGFYDLFEGNDANTVHFDNIHGSSAAGTLFRSRLIGQDTPAKTSALVAIHDAASNRAENFVGNVLGTPGVQTGYWSNDLFPSGFAYNMDAQSDNAGTPNDPLVTSTSLRWGNYDVVTRAVRWCGNSSDTGWSATCASTSEIPTSGVAYIHGNPVPTKGDLGAALPASFYLPAQPSFWQTPWGTPPWPAIGPDVGGGTAPDGVGGYSYAIPAQLCYANTLVDPAYQQTFTVSGASWSSGTATLTIGSHTLAPANTVIVSGVSPSGPNGTFAVTAATPTTLSYALPSNPGTYTSGGTVAYPNILLFNAANCYPVAYGGSAPAPPPAPAPASNLAAIAQ